MGFRSPCIVFFSFYNFIFMFYISTCLYILFCLWLINNIMFKISTASMVIDCCVKLIMFVLEYLIILGQGCYCCFFPFFEIISRESLLVLCAIILSKFIFLMHVFIYCNYFSKAILLSLCSHML